MTGQPGMGRVEFVALMAMLVATVVFSIDAMLPALPKIGANLTPAHPNHAQLIVTSFILGLGIGTFFTGPLPDTFGRKPVILTGASVYIAWQTTIFFQAALTLGNLNALAMEPLGHIAGMAASVIGSLATVGSVILTVPIGLAFDGTPMPLFLGVLICVATGFGLMKGLARRQSYEP